MRSNKIQTISEQKAERLVNELVFCAYCSEPFKECDSVIPGIGVVIGEMDVVRYGNKFWHRGCVTDFIKLDNLRATI